MGKRLFKVDRKSPHAKVLIQVITDMQSKIEKFTDEMVNENFKRFPCSTESEFSLKMHFRINAYFAAHYAGKVSADMFQMVINGFQEILDDLDDMVPEGTVIFPNVIVDLDSWDLILDDENA